MRLAPGGAARNFTAFLLGLSLTLALPPLFLTLFLFVAFSGLFLLLNSASSRKRAFWDGWWFGLGNFVTGLYWICESMFVDIAQFWWAVPFALLGLPVMLAIFTGLMGMLYKIMKREALGASYEGESVAPRSSPLAPNLLLFAALWVLTEYARGHLFTGFPWNLAGYVWTVSDVTLQPASLIGVYGLSWLTAIIGAIPALWILKDKRAKPYALAALLICLVLAGWGYARLGSHPTVYTDVTLRIVQPNIAQTLKWDPEAEKANFLKHVKLSKQTGRADIILWPEAAIPFPLGIDKPIPPLAHIAQPGGLLITGGLRIEGDEQNYKIWNSLFAVDAEGMIQAHYDKRKLVPFGEYIPLRSWLPLKKLTHGSVDFSDGGQGNELEVGKFPAFASLICYEAIFPGLTRGGAVDAAASVYPSWIVNITNDAWFGNSTGPRQHLQMVRTRAVEQGLPLARSANTGISAIIDAYGRVLQTLPLGTEGVIDTKLPAAAPKTLYARYGDWVILLIATITLIARVGFILARRRYLSS